MPTMDSRQVNIDIETEEEDEPTTALISNQEKTDQFQLKEAGNATSSSSEVEYGGFHKDQEPLQRSDEVSFLNVARPSDPLSSIIQDQAKQAKRLDTLEEMLRMIRKEIG